jgi:very-short-patch-repair endonuclease
VEVFKAYLQYAETGALDGEAVAVKAGVSTIFEEEVAEFLRAMGFDVQMKVGTAGFFIDLAVFDPDRPGAFLLGIECDGPEYNRARTARDRDRLRQQVLEGLGWNVYRVWSVEWFAHPIEDKARLMAVIEAAQKGEPVAIDVTREEADQLREKRLEELKAVRREATSAKLTGAASQPAYEKSKLKIRLSKKELIEQSPAKLSKWIVEIVQTESPIFRDLAYARFLDAAGKRTGSRNAESFEKGLAEAVSQQEVRREGDLLFDVRSSSIMVRDRRKLSTEERKFEWVADPELDEAIVIVVRQSFGMEKEDISVAASRLMGFDRTTEPMRARTDARVHILLATGRLVERDEQIQIPS